MALPPTDRNYRLPQSIRPVRYDAFLSIDLERGTFEGRLRISLSIEREAAWIALHAAGLEVSRATVTVRGAALEGKVDAFTASETVLLTTGDPDPRRPRGGGARPGRERSAPACAASIAPAPRRDPVRGIRRPARLPLSRRARLQGTVGARRGGAAGDRGSRRTAGRSAGRRAGEREVVHFAETPPLPTYLVALVAGPMAACAEERVRGVPVRTWAVPEKADLTAFGQEAAVAVLPRLEDYFDVPYAFGKLDQIGLPDFEFGAMENAGLVTYRETALLLDPASASLPVKKRVAEVVTHELAHQWFGNWVTMALVGRPLAERVVRHLDGLQDRGGLEAGVAHLARLRPGQGGRARPRRAPLHPSHPRGGAQPGGHGGGLRPHHLREGRGGAPHDRGVARRGALPQGDPALHAPLRPGQRRGRRPVEGSPGGLGTAGERARQPLDPRNRASRSWALARDGAKVRLTQRRFLSEPGAREEGTWPVPVVLRYRRRPRDRGSNGCSCARPPPRSCSTRRGRSGGSSGTPDRPASTGSTTRRRTGTRSPATSPRCGPRSASRSSPTSGRCSGPAIRAPEPFLDLLAAFAGEEDRAVLDELVGRLGAVEHRLADPVARDRFRALRRRRSCVRRSTGSGWTPAPARTARRACGGLHWSVEWRSWPATRMRPPQLATRLDRFLAGDRDALEANLHDAAVAVAARDGDEARFAQFRRLAREEKDPALLRRYRMGDGALRGPARGRGRPPRSRSATRCRSRTWPPSPGRCSATGPPRELLLGSPPRALGRPSRRASPTHRSCCDG